MGWVLVTLLVAPLVVTGACWGAGPRWGRPLTVASGCLTLALALLLVPARTTTALAGWLRVDALSVVFIVAVTFVYASTSLFALGYLKPARHPEPARHHDRHLLAGLNLFAWAMVMTPIVNGVGLLWVAMEITTVVSALLVAIDQSDGSVEAAWKYALIASMGLGIALLGTIAMYYAGSSVLGGSYDPFYPSLMTAAPHLPQQMVRLAFVLAIVGYGTKMGLVPLHTWLPDAHSEAPTPVSAMLSAALLGLSFYAILRFYQVTERAVGAAFPRDVLLAFGLASLALAAMYLAGQRDLKRLLAYSSIEHMGVLAVGMSFSAPVAVTGVLLHVLAHSAAKGTAFFGAGSIVRKYGTKDMARIRGAVGALPWTGPMMVLTVLALSALPPFGIFRSEFLIVLGGLSAPRDAAAAVLVALVTVAFLGISWSATRAAVTPTPGGVLRGETSPWMAGAMVIGILALVILGLHPPSQLSHLLTRAAGELAVPR